MEKNSGRTKKYTALFITAFASFITPFLGSSINVALPQIGRHFQMDAVTLSWVTTVYLLASAVFLVPFGKMADLYGRRKVFTIGVSIVSFTSLLAAFAPNTTGFILLRVLQGVGSAMIFGTGIAIITSVFPKQERGKAMGINVAAVYVGLTMGPFAGGVLTSNLGWQSIFLAIFPLGMLVVLLTLFKLKQEWAEARGEQFDWKGSLLYGISLTLFMYGLSQLPDWHGFIFIGAGLAGIWIFALFELRIHYPVFNMNLLLKNRKFAFASISALINYSATFGVSFLMSLYMQYVKGMNAQGAGEVLMIQPVVMALFSPVAGKISDRVDPGIVATLGLIFLTIGLSVFITLDANSSVVFIGAILAFFGLGYALFSSPNTNAMMSAVDRKYYGIASGTVGTMRLVGQLISMGTVMMIFSLLIGQVEISEENQLQFIDSAHIAFIVFTLFGVLGILLSAFRIDRQKLQILKRNY